MRYICLVEWVPISVPLWIHSADGQISLENWASSRLKLLLAVRFFLNYGMLSRFWSVWRKPERLPFFWWTCETYKTTCPQWKQYSKWAFLVTGTTYFWMGWSSSKTHKNPRSFSFSSNLAIKCKSDVSKSRVTQDYQRLKIFRTGSGQLVQAGSFAAHSL